MHMHSQQMFLFWHFVFKLKLKYSLIILKYVIFYVSIVEIKKGPNVAITTKTDMQLISANPKGINLQIVKYQMFRTIHINAVSSPTQNFNIELHTFEILMRL